MKESEGQRRGEKYRVSNLDRTWNERIRGTTVRWEKYRVSNLDRTWNERIRGTTKGGEI